MGGFLQRGLCTRQTQLVFLSACPGAVPLQQWPWGAVIVCLLVHVIHRLHLMRARPVSALFIHVTRSRHAANNFGWIWEKINKNLSLEERHAISIEFVWNYLTLMSGLGSNLRSNAHQLGDLSKLQKTSVFGFVLIFRGAAQKPILRITVIETKYTFCSAPCLEM